MTLVIELQENQEAALKAKAQALGVLYSQININQSQLIQLSELRLDYRSYFDESAKEIRDAPVAYKDEAINQLKDTSIAFDEDVENVIGVDRFKLVKQKRDDFNLTLSQQNISSQITSNW